MMMASMIDHCLPLLLCVMLLSTRGNTHQSVGTTKFYFMDNSTAQCDQCIDFKYPEDEVFVKAWMPGHYSTRMPYSSTCSLTISSYYYLNYGFKEFSSLYFVDCSVTLNIYNDRSSDALLLESFNCHAALSVKSSHHLTRSIRVDLINSALSSDFDFNLYVTATKRFPQIGLKELAILVFVLLLMFDICICTCCCCCQRRS